MNKGIGKRDAGTRRREDAAIKTELPMRTSLASKTNLAASPRLRIPALIVFLAFCILPLALTSCAPSRASVVSADATTGYCVVCKMKVNAADPWASEIHYSDGTKLMFETPGDMVTFYSAPERYEVPDAQRNRANITKVVVKDYQTGQSVDARQASLVYKSRIESDMGPDFVPLASRDAADRFVAANGGTVVALGEVTPEMVQNLRKK